MTLPNRLSFSRLYLTLPYIILFGLLFESDLLDAPVLQWSGLVVLWAVYLYCEISDLADGHIARKQHLITPLGKILDPFCDVISRMTYFVLFAWAGILPMYILLLLLLREFSVLFVRMLSALSGAGALSAGIGGKIKANFYVLGSFLGFAALSVRLITHQELIQKQWSIFLIVFYVIFVIAVIAAWLSLWRYASSLLKKESVKELLRKS